MTTAIVVFLALHGLLHLAIWVPQPAPGSTPPFHPDHSVVLSAVHVPRPVEHQLAVGLATGAAAAYLLAAISVWVDDAWTVGVVIAAALLGLVLKVLYAHPWLSVGVTLDLLVLTSATVGWPVAL